MNYPCLLRVGHQRLIKPPGPLSSRSIQRHASLTRHSNRRSPPLAFVFDIDGVLIRGEDVLPPAKRALSKLAGDNPFNMFVLPIGQYRTLWELTNGGGVTEEERCARLTEKLHPHNIHPRQYVQAHTILKSMAHRFANEPVLVLGGKFDQVRRAAENYGFNKAYTTHDVLNWNPSVWPFHQLTDRERAATQTVDFSDTRISAVFVFHDPRNWALDVQVLCDVIQSGGFIGGPYIPLEKQTRPIDLVFCNPDLIWRSDFDRPRLGQGAFKTAFQSVFKSLTGSEYPHVQFGKPSRATYDFAADVMRKHMQQMPDYDAHSPLPPIYMVGDNPESDIAGANAAGWDSILVKTGVFSGENPTHIPTCIAEDVEEAVDWAIRREVARWTELR